LEYYFKDFLMERYDEMTPDELYQLGQEYEWGLGREQDFEKALHLYQLASDQNHTEAKKCLSMMVEEGRGCDPDAALASALWPNA
jgi:TPR repeat protein